MAPTGKEGNNEDRRNLMAKLLLESLRPKVLVIGHGGHGKDTLCERLRDQHGLPFISSSEFVAREVIYQRLAGFYGGDYDKMYADRRNHRELWRDLIAQYCADDPARTVKGMRAMGYYTYCGMRARREFEVAKTMFDWVVWVDRCDVLPPDPSMELVPDDATYFIDNNGSLSGLYVAADRLAEIMLDTGK